MLSSFCVTLFATACLSHSIPPFSTRSIAESPLNIQLSHTDGSIVKAVISNRGKVDVRLLRPGSILDVHSLEKLRVSRDGTPVNFMGIVPNFAMNNWKPEHFITISAGQTLENTIDLSETHDLSSGGSYQVIANSRIPYAQTNSDKIVGSIPYKSNVLSLNLDPQSSSTPTNSLSSPLQKRSRFMPDCTLPQISNLTRAAYLGAAWAGAGAYEALKIDSPIWQRYFRINSTTEDVTPQVLNKFHAIVSTRLANVALELSSGVVSEIHCKADIQTSSRYQEGNFNLCETYPGQAIAYTIRPTCQVALCPLYWKLENKNEDCMSDGMKGGFEQTGVLIHELTHCNTLGQVGLQPSTDDLAYDYDDTINDEYMTPGASIQNAQSHALFAKASYVKGAKC